MVRSAVVRVQHGCSDVGMDFPTVCENWGTLVLESARKYEDQESEITRVPAAQPTALYLEMIGSFIHLFSPAFPLILRWPLCAPRSLPTMRRHLHIQTQTFRGLQSKNIPPNSHMSTTQSTSSKQIPHPARTSHSFIPRPLGLATAAMLRCSLLRS